MSALLFQSRVDVRVVMAVRSMEVRVNRIPMAQKRIVVIIGQRAWKAASAMPVFESI